MGPAVNLRLNDATDLHSLLLSKTLEAALMAQTESDQRVLERLRREIIKTLNHWVSHNRESFVQAYPAYRGLCAFDCIDAMAEDRVAIASADLQGSLRAWDYAERSLASFLLIAARNPIPGVRLALMYEHVSKSSWPIAA